MAMCYPEHYGDCPAYDASGDCRCAAIVDAPMRTTTIIWLESIIGCLCVFAMPFVLTLLFVACGVGE